MQQTGTSWLSKGAEALETRMQDFQDETTHCDVLIVGSGYGGAVAAARLAGSTVIGSDGRPRAARIWLLERGAEHLLGSFSSRFSELAGHVRFSMQDGRPPRGNAKALLDVRIGPDMSVLVGNGLGGGSLINAGVMEKPEDDIFTSGWPAAITLDEMRLPYAKALSMLGAKAMKLQAANNLPKFRILNKLSSSTAKPCALTVNLTTSDAASVAGVVLKPCTLCGDCMTGCNQGAKGSLDTSYLAWARDKVEMFCGGVVEKLTASDQEGQPWTVTWHYTDPRKRGASPQALRAQRVILAAGSLGSTEILLRSRVAGLDMSDKLGQHFSANGDSIMAGVGHKEAVHSVADPESDPAEAGARIVGPTITGLFRIAPAGAPAFVVQEFAVPAALRQVFGEIASTAASIFGNTDNRDFTECTPAFIDHTSLFGLMGDDGAAGSLLLPRLPQDAPAVEGAIEAGLRIQWENAIGSPLNGSMGAWRDCALMDTSGAVATPLPMALTVHPLGGCRMANDCAHGVVDDMGRVYKPGGGHHSGLAVLDGAIVPRALAINPALTITALAERALPKLMAAWGLSKSDAGPASTFPQRPAPLRRRELPPAHVQWGLSETMTGEFTPPGEQAWKATLRLTFEDIPGFARALQSPERVPVLRRGRLELQRDTGQGQERCTAELAGSMRLLMPQQGSAAKSRLALQYRLSVQSLQASGASPLRVGGRLDGLKLFGQLDIAPLHRSGLRQLSEMDVRYDGTQVGRWALDWGDLAEHGEALLSLKDMSSMPDALADLGAIGLYLLRKSKDLVTPWFTNEVGAPQALNLADRYPALLDGCIPEVFQLNRHGARLSHYGEIGAEHKLPPVLLLHGLGTSGNTFSHPAIANNLVRTLRKGSRDVWLLDFCSSIGNEAGRKSVASADWTVDQIAQEEIPLAIEVVLKKTGFKQLDVFAHCFGAVMFCAAMLSDETEHLADKIRAVVLSQVGPLLKPSPLNRFRGHVMGYLQTYLRMGELDTCPDFVSSIDAHGGVTWQRTEARGYIGGLHDALLAAFPYPDDDDEAVRAKAPALAGVDFLRIRHRADAMFGQLFELAHLSDATLQQLDALIGWVKVPMLAQAIHFARLRMLTDVQGRNTRLNAVNLAARFNFPLLMIHGRRNRVFDWEGSLDSLRLLEQMRGQPPSPEPMSVDGCTHYGVDTPTQLAVFQTYGHLDCVIGEDAHADVFPAVLKFLSAPPRRAGTKSLPQLMTAQPPWIGPVMGWLRPTQVEGQHCLRLSLMLQAHPQEAKTDAVALVPVTLIGGVATPQLDQSCILPWPGDQAPTTLQLWFRQPLASESYAVFTLHNGNNGGTAWAGGNPSVGCGETSEALNFGTRIDPNSRNAIEKVLADGVPGLLRECLFSLPTKLIDAADLGEASTARAKPLRFAVASCQYPPGLFDEAVAGASYQRLARDALAVDGPQFLLQVGDQVYLDATAGAFDTAARPAGAVKAGEVAGSYALNLRLPPLRRVAARLPVYPMLDDHEVSNDWSGNPLADGAQVALAAYQLYQQNLAPTRILGGVGSRSYCLNPGGLPFFVLDTRSARDHARSATTIATAAIFPDAVMSALLYQLSALPTYLPKFIVSPSPLLPPERCVLDSVAERLGSDTWSGFPASMARLLTYIRDKNIRRVVLLSGDAHLSSVSRFTFNDGDNSVLSIVSSGLYAPWPFANQRPEDVILDHPALDLGMPGAPCMGRMSQLALSTANGYACVDVAPNTTADMPTRLTISLRSANGGETDCSADIT